MSSGERKPATNEKEQIRQREVENHLVGLRSPAPHLRAAAARRLGDLRAGVDELIACLNDPVESVRAAAVMALGSFPSDSRRAEIIETLLGTIDDPSEKVCQAAIRSLGLLHAVEARDEIEEFLDDPNPFILGAAIVSLARLSADDLAPRLAGYLNHPSDYVRTQAVRAAGMLRYQPASDTIFAMLEQTRIEIAAEGFSSAMDAANHRESDTFHKLSQLIRAAGALGISRAAPTLLEIAQKDVGFRGLAVEALIAIGAEIDPGMLIGLLSDPSAYLRKRLVRLICQCHYLPALPALRSLLHESNVAIRDAALQALAQMGDAESLPRIRWICFHDSNPFVRLQALQALYALQQCKAEADFTALAGDANFQIRRAATSFLLECASINPSAHSAMRSFADAYPEDPLSAGILSALPEPAAVAGDAPGDQPPQVLLFPPAIQEHSQGLTAALTAWRSSLEGSTDPEQRALSAAIDFLLGALRNPRPE